MNKKKKLRTFAPAKIVATIRVGEFAVPKCWRLFRHAGRFFLFAFFFLSSFSSFSQTSDETLPVFILQGVVKLKGKPAEGVSLELTKDKKKINKIVTEKNGMYSMEMNKSFTDMASEYCITIVKEGAVTGILRINTFTPKEDFDYVPYIFNLEFNLVTPTFSNATEVHDFGKIKWISERAVFDFDKDYSGTIEKNAEVSKPDSAKSPIAVFDKAMTDSLGKAPNKEGLVIQNKEETINNKQEDVVKNKQEEVIKSKPDNEAKQKANPIAAIPTAVQDSLPEISALKEKVGAEKNLPKKMEQAGSHSDQSPLRSGKSLTTEKAVMQASGKLKNSKPRPENDITKKKTDEPLKLKTSENTGKLVDLKEQKEANRVSISKAQIEEKAVQQPSAKPDIPNLKAEPSNSSVDQNSFDSKNIFSINNEKSKLYSAKEKMERTKSANLSKKYESSNVLTSLLDVIAVYDKK